MLQLSATIVHRQVLSLRTSAPIADIVSPIINPDNLKIEGFYCKEYDSKNLLILLYQDIRDVIAQGIIVDDFDALTDPSELIKYRELLENEFQLIGKPVETISKDKVGKVNDYAFESTTMYIQKLYVSQSLLKNLTSGGLSVDRTQIQEITPKAIIIQDLLQTAPVNASPVSA